jgi:hypothetical protein
VAERIHTQFVTDDRPNVPLPADAPMTVIEKPVTPSVAAETFVRTPGLGRVVSSNVMEPTAVAVLPNRLQPSCRLDHRADGAIRCAFASDMG